MFEHAVPTGEYRGFRIAHRVFPCLLGAGRVRQVCVIEYSLVPEGGSKGTRNWLRDRTKDPEWQW